MIPNCIYRMIIDRLFDYPVEKWKGGKVHRIRSSVIHLMRGQVFQIDGKKIFTFGGANPSIHRMTIDRATERKEKWGDRK